MTVKELKEKLNKFDDNLIVMIPNSEYYSGDSLFPNTVAEHISQGVNELDGCVFIEDGICCETCRYYDTDIDDQPCCSCIDGENWEVIENKCAGCVYEDADDSTEDIGNCVCCSRINNSAKNDYCKKK